MLDLIEEDFAVRHTVDAALMKRNVAFDSQNVVALVLFNRLVQRLFGLFAGSGHNRVVVVERHHVRHHIGDDRRIGSDEGFRAAGAFQAVEPDNGRARFGFHRMGDFLRTGAPESEARRSERAELQEAAAADAAAAQRLVLRFKHVGLPSLEKSGSSLGTGWRVRRRQASFHSAAIKDLRLLLPKSFFPRYREIAKRF